MPAASVSVIVPCYRQAHFLSAALDSVLSQSHPAIEPIVINDGSDDDTDAVAKRFGDRVHYVSQANQGLPAARNRGIQEAQGKYVLFLDADDQLHPDAVAWQVEAMGDADNRVCLMGHRRFEVDPAESGQVEYVPEGTLSFFPHFIHECAGPPHAFLSSRHMVNAVGQFASLRSCEDWDLWLRLAHQGAELVPVPRLGAYYRRYPGSMSTQGLAMLENRTQVLLRLHGRMLASSEFLERWGEDLLAAEHRVRRRCLAQRADAIYVAALTQAIAELKGRGCRLRESVAKKCLGWIFGETADWLSFHLLLKFFPRRMARYKEGYT